MRTARHAARRRGARREEIARMLAGATVTDEARAAAERLIGRGVVDGVGKPTSPARSDRPVGSLTEAGAELRAPCTSEIAAHDRRYHQNDAPTITDADYDALRRRNDAIEARFPGAGARRLACSAARRRAAGRGFAKVRHRCRCCRLAKPTPTRTWPISSSARRRFFDSPRTLPLPFTAEPKIDGLSASLRYENGVLVAARRAATARSARTSPRTCAPSPTSRSG